ncbi:MAG: TraR/DksA C4-type zinc finger protein [bacterium]|nr:TraR/DksA C4-type zinc finger protein [bacterium]
MTLDTNAFKKKLLTEKALVETELSTVARRNPQNPADWEPKASDAERPAERDEVADKLESFEENIAIARQLESRLGEIRDALERIENGSYGHCIVCKNEIETDRLGANPAAVTCKAHLK